MADSRLQDQAGEQKRGRGRLVLAALGSFTLVVITALVTPVGDRIIDAIFARAAGDESPLVVVSQSWPQPEGRCWKTADVAMRPGGPAAEQTTFNSALLEPLAATYGEGTIGIRLSGREEKALYIYALRLVVFSSDPELVPAWVGYFEGGGCGEVKTRLFEGNIDKSLDLVDRGIIGESGEDDPDAPTEALGADFTVSANDPAHLLATVRACKGYYEFGLEVSYNYDGRNYQDVIASPSEPFRIVGDGISVPAYGYADFEVAPVRTGDTTARTDCLTGLPQTPAVTESVNIQPSISTVFPAPFAGSWTGTLRESDGQTWPMEVVITAGQASGTVRYPTLECSGTLTLIQLVGSNATARETINAGSCTPSGTMALSLSNSRLDLSYFPDNNRYTATASLARA